LTEEFVYKERVLEFGEVTGVHSGDNMADMVYCVLKELELTKKLITVTADNAGNNGTFVESLGLKLKDEIDGPRFQGRESFINCLAHVLNLIVKDILKALKCGDTKAADKACDQIHDGKPIGLHSAMSRLRILSLWILRTPQRREGWKSLCSIHGLKNKYIEYDVDNRWNSTYRMLRDGLAAKEQIRCYLNAVGLLPSFTALDWQQLEQIARVLEKFEEFTNLVSRKGLSISLSIGIYYELQDLLDNASTRQGEFADLDEEVAFAVAEGLQKYHKYYDFLDEQDAYYIALILDPRFKAELLKAEIKDEEAAKLIVEAMKERLHREYPLVMPERIEPVQRVEKPTLESRMLLKLQPRRVSRSDIDKYFEEETVAVATTEEGWLLQWWRAHKEEYPQMAAAARDYLAIPASEVAVERLFSGGRDLLGLRRHSLESGTMRTLTLLADQYSKEEDM
jgi:hypothetical protein